MTQNLDAALRRLGHATFRPGQREAIETLLRRGRLLLVAPTGGGKSLTYQLPASLLPGTTLVVSPLIALMHDQVEALARSDVASTYLASSLDPAEISRRLSALGRGEYQLVYVAPERLAQPAFRTRLADLDCPLVAIDEAHCISEWGHDFRPEYHQIGEVLDALPAARVLACTATATPIVRDEILAKLGLPADTPQLVHGFARPNLALRAAKLSGRPDRNRRVDAALAEALAEPGAARGKAIVYSPTRRAAEEETARLGEAGWRCRFYHAGLSGEARSEAHGAFTSDELDLVVATNAFGMWIDEPDVRAVIHLGPPGSLEAYYQEVGRAGRDAKPALGLLLWSGNDLLLRRHLLERESEGVAPAPELVEHKWNLFLELMRWAEGGSCRHDAILRYFGDEEETLAGCGVCDVCQRLAAGPEAAAFAPEETVEIVRKALSAIARVHGRFGMGAAAKLLHGDADPRLERSGLDCVSTFGVLSEHRSEWITRVLRRCVTAGLVGFGGDDRPVALLTESGWRVMHAEIPPRIELPPVRIPANPPRAGRRGRSSREVPASSPEETALFDALRVHRLELARATGVPPYVVAHDRTLHDMARRQPGNREELLLVDGIGPAKAKRYGEGFLEVVRRHTAPS
jgi:ATP-dependent DNA helicase RecQ